MKIYAAKVGDLSEQLINMLDKERQRKIDKIKVVGEKKRSAYAGALLRYTFLQEHSLQEWDQIVIERNEHGKPHILLPNGERFIYSLSHSGEYVICVTANKEVGIDIQEMKKDKDAIAKRFFAKEEYERLSSSDDKDKNFYKMWTAKEAYAKYTGLGIGGGIDKYIVSDTYERIDDISIQKSVPIYYYDIIKEYMICVCSKEKTFPKQLEIVTDKLYV